MSFFENTLCILLLFIMFEYFLVFIYRRYMTAKYILMSALILGGGVFFFFSRASIELERGGLDPGLIGTLILVLCIHSIFELYRKITTDDF